MAIKRILLAFTAVILSCMAMADTAAQQLVKLLHFNTAQATFKQVTYVNKRAARHAAGTMSIKRPGLFRWQVTQPMPSLLIINQTTVWNYDEDLAQATKQRISQAQGINAASLLSGHADKLAQQFSIRRMGSGALSNSGFALTPRSQTVFNRIELRFKAGKLSEMQTFNAIGQRTVFSFSDVRYDLPLSNKLFTFKPPKGVDVLTNG